MIRKILMGLAAVVGFTTAATAATPVAVWDGDFTTATKSGWTIAENGNTKTDTSITIVAGKKGVLVTPDAAKAKQTVIVRYSDLARPTANNGYVLGTVAKWNVTDANQDYVGTASVGTDGKAYGLFQTKYWHNSNTVQTQAVVPQSGKFGLSYDRAVKTQLMGSSGLYYSATGLKSSNDTGATFEGFTIGGMRYTVTTTNSGYTYSPAAGMVITGIAVFESTLTQDEVAAYKFESDLTTHKSRVEAGGDWDWTALDWNPEVTDPASSKLELTIVATDALFTMDEDPNCYSLDVTGTMKIKVDAAGEDIAKKTAVGAPYADWLFKTTGAVTGTFEPVFNSALPAGYTASYEIVAGQGVRYVVTAPAWAKFGATSVNLKKDTDLGAGTSGFYPVDRSLWNNLTIGASASETYDGITFTLSSNASSYKQGGVGDPIYQDYIDDAQGGGVTKSVTISNITEKYPQYRIIVYFNSDDKSATKPFYPMVVNDVSYAGAYKDGTPSYTVKGSTSTWGQNGQRGTPAEGNNALVTDVMTDDTATLNFYNGTSGRTNGRATPAAIQIVKVGEVLAEQEYTATINEDTNWNEIQWSPEPTGGFPVNAKLILTAEDSPTITFTAIENLDRPVVINGAVTLKAADDLYVDGCWEEAIATFYSFTADDVTFADIKSGFSGAYTQTATGFNLRAQNKEVISINIAGGRYGGTGADSPEENLVTNAAVYYGIAPTVGDSWNNINRQWQSGGDQTITIDSPLAYDGAQTIQRPTMSLSATGRNTWQCGSITNPFLRGYLDDVGGVTVTVHGVPYTEYDVIVYVTSDSNLQLAPVTINGTTYTYVDGELVEGETAWGVGMYPTPEIGKNAIRINGCKGEQLTVSAAARTSGSQDPRGTFCAVQVINKGDVVVTTDYVGVMSGNVEWTDGAEDENLKSVGDPWVPGEYSTITITNIAKDATFTFTQETEGLKFKVVSDAGCALTIPAKSMVEFGKLKTYDFTEAAGGVTIELPADEAFDPATLPQIEGGNWKFSKTGTLVFNGKFPTAAEQAFFTNEVDWAGTVWFKNVTVANQVFNDYGNANSKLRFTGVKGWFNYSKNETTLPIELVDEGETRALEVTDGSKNKAYIFDKVTGEGSINVSSVHTDPFIVQFKDVSEHTGKITSLASTTPAGDPTTAFPILIGEMEGALPYGTTSKITVADGAAINLECGWEAESVAFGATLMLMSGAEGGKIIEGLTMQTPVYLATKVLYPEESNPDFSCLGYEDDAIWLRKAAEFSIDPGENATVTTVLGAFKEGDSYYAANEAPVQVTFTATEGYLFPNGSTTLTVDEEAGEGATIEPTDEPVQAEAKIGTTYYLTLAAALDAAKDKDVITLLKNVTFAPNGKYTLDKTIYLTLGGFNLTGNGATTFEVVNNAALYVTATDSTVSALRINVGRATNDNGSLFISGGTWTIDNNAIIHVNGTCKSCTVVTQDADFTSNGDNAIQFCGAGTFSIDGGTITGATAVYVKAGTLSIAADLVANGEKKPYVYSANGANATGDALVIDNCGYPEGPATVSLLEGTTLTSAHAEKMGYYVYNSSPEGTVTKDATVDVNTPEGYLWKDGTTLTKAEAKIGTTYYLTLQEALNVGGDVVMLKDVAKEVTVPADKTVNLDFNGFAITTTSRQAINNYGRLTVTNGNVTAQESAIVLWGESVTTISGGTYTSKDNAVIAGNGNAGQGDVALHITGGTFNGGITTAGYIACGIYVPNSGTYTISGGQFNITGGCGVCARAGEIKVASEAEFNLGGSAEPGKVGDCTNLVPCVSMYIDYGAGYPGHAETDYLKAKDNTLSTADTQTWVGPDGEGYYTLTVKTGPQPVPGSPTEVDPVPGEENTYIVTPTGTTTDLAVQGAKDGDTFIINGVSVTSLTLDNNDVTVTVMNGNGNVDITGAVYGWNEPKLTLKTSSANETYKFSTELDPEQVGLAVNGITVGANVDVAVTSYVGLTYTLVRSETVGGEGKPVTGSAQVAAETTTTLTDTGKLAGQAFYKVKVTK